jgi:hypothetical protein
VASEGGRRLTDPGEGKAANLRDGFQSIQPSEPRVRVGHEVIVVDRPSAAHILEIRRP